MIGPGLVPARHLLELKMKPIHFMTAVALVAAGSALAAEAKDHRTAHVQPAPVQRADVIAETKRAMANGDLKFGPLADYQAQFLPAPAPALQASRHALTRGGMPQGQTVAQEAVKPALPMPQPRPHQPAQK